MSSDSTLTNVKRAAEDSLTTVKRKSEDVWATLTSENSGYQLALFAFVLGVILLAIGSGYATTILTSFGVVLLTIAVVAAVINFFKRSQKTSVEKIGANE